MSATEFIAKLTVIKSSNLPKTDLLSTIDPYVVIQVNNQKFKTKKKENDENPLWNESFYPLLARDPNGLFAGSLELTLYDKGMLSDTKVATVSIPLAGATPASLLAMTASWTFLNKKHEKAAKNATVELSITGYVQSYKSLRNMYMGVAGVFFDDQRKALYIPVAESNGLVYIGLQQDSQEHIDVKVLLTAQINLFVDMALLGRGYTKVYRHTYHQGLQYCPGLFVYEEVKLDDMSICTDFAQVMILVFDSHRLSSTNSDDVVTAHGWRGALNFETAARTLQNIDVDHHEREVYMTIDAGETLLMIDYEEDDADVKLAVLASPSTADKGYDLTIRGQDVTKFSEIFIPPRSKLGKYMISRVLQLDQVEYGTNFQDIEVHRFQLRNPRQHSVQGITRLHG